MVKKNFFAFFLEAIRIFHIFAPWRNCTGAKAPLERAEALIINTITKVKRLRVSNFNSSLP